MLGIVNVNDRESLEKLSKKQLIKVVVQVNKAKDELIEKIVNLTEEELIEFQKDVRFWKAIINILGVAI